MKTPCLTFSILLALATTTTWSQSSKVITAPKKEWIDQISFDKQATPAVGQESSYYYLLIDEQENFIQQEDYRHYAYKILTTEGVQQMSDLSFEFDPSYEKLIMHAITVHRNEEVINQLPKEIRTIQREQSMDRFLYDGTQTAVINLTDVRVGDIVEFSYTKKGYNPIYGGYINRKVYFNNYFSFEKGYQKVIAPAATDLSFKYANTTKKPEIKREKEKVSYTWSSSRVPAVMTDNYEPGWYNSYEHVFISSFKTWGEVIAWADKNFYVSELDKQVVSKEIASKFKGPSKEAYALQAIRFVQDEIRYLGFESGLNSHRPHAPIKVYNQRFGDCKDKSLLLVMLLRAKDIEAYPVLVNTTYRDKITEQLPSTNAFDHCVVQLKINDSIVYIDPTINDQGGSLFTNYFPDYRKGLVVNLNLTELVKIPTPTVSSTTEIQTFDMTEAGGEAKLKIKTIYKGGNADGQRSYFSMNNLETVQKDYLTYYGNLYPDISKFETIKVRDQRDSNIFVVEESYTIAKIWNKDDSNENIIYCDFYPQSLEGYFNVSKSSQRTAPYALTYPLNFFHEIHVNTGELWEVTEDEKKIESDYYTYDYKVKYDDRHLSIHRHYATKASMIPVDGFSKFVEDHQEVTNSLTYRISVDQTSIKAKSNKWPGIIVGILAVIAGVLLMLWLYRSYDPQPYYPAAWGQPIGGWLVLVAIGATITPFLLLRNFYQDPTTLNGEGWLIMFYAKNYLAFLYFFVIQIYNICILLFVILVIVLFYQRRSSVPKLISIVYGLTLVVAIMDSVVLSQIDPTAKADVPNIIRSVVAAAIWIPYFHMSNRVKKTFVNRYTNEENEATY